MNLEAPAPGAEQLAVALAKREEELRHERAIAACARALLSGDDSERVEDALHALLDASDSASLFVAANVEDASLGLCSRLIRGVSRPSVEQESNRWKLVPWSRMPDAFAALPHGVPFVFRVEDLSPQQQQEYAGSRVRAGAQHPIFLHGRWVGLVGFADLRADRSWSDDELRLLAGAADLFARLWERQEQKQQLEELIRSKDEFLAAVSHELRTPLTTVVGLAEELRDRAAEFSTDEQRELNAIVAEQGIEMANIVDDLLVAARGDAAKIELEIGPVDVRSEITKIIDSVATGREVAIGARESCLALADGMRVRQILRNLVTNAIRYGGPNTRIDCAKKDGTVAIWVSDDGAPIEAASRDRIFEAYQRAHAGTTEPASVGLGLTVSRRLARLMGGDLLYRRHNARNTFELTLPAATEPGTDPPTG